MKKISVVVPTYNEQDNVINIAGAIKEQFDNLTAYDWELIFIDNDSKDNTRALIRGLCSNDRHIKAIFNVRNFGQNNSPIHGILQSTGDCTIVMGCDFQEPPEMIPVFVKNWEEGYKIVAGQKTSSKENKLIYMLRGIYYKMMKRFSDTDVIEQVTGFGLYDKSFLNVVRELHDPMPVMRSLIAELGFGIKLVPFTQNKRRAGKSSNNFFTLYDMAMQTITSYTKIGLRSATFIGGTVGLISIIIAIVYFIRKLIHWYSFPMGIAPLVIGVFLLGGIQLFFIGMLGEYVLNINTRLMNRPLVVEEERINFESENEGKESK